MGAKSRGNFAVNGCIVECENRDKLCDVCHNKDKKKNPAYGKRDCIK